jgi:flagellar biogenesis protein FliO
MAAATETHEASPAGESVPAPGVSQERFLQHFISRSLGQPASAAQETPAVSAPVTPQQSPRSGAASRAPEAASTPALELGASLRSTVLTMVFSLGAILGCLLIAAYLVRRYLFSPATSGKRAASLRVLARTHLTPKAVVALLEVPGKTLVIGVTGSTLVTLGEVVADPDSTSKETPAISANGTSFAMALEQSANEDKAAEAADETLWQVSERIQRKVSRLKQL